MEEFKVKTDHFEGPLDLLLNLIEKRKFFINDISLSQVADDFINHIKTEVNFPMADSANFILVASTLVLIKSKSLLPTLDLTREEQESVSDLEARLKAYQRVKSLSSGIQSRFGQQIQFGKQNNKLFAPVFTPSHELTIPALLNAVKNVLNSLPKIEALPKIVVNKIISLEEMIGNLTDRISEKLKLSFKEFSQQSRLGREERVNIIIGFLAMLELVKQGIINVKQDQLFSDIEMEHNQLSVPKYW